MSHSKRQRGWPPDPEPLPFPVPDNHTHLDLVVTWRAEGWPTPAPAPAPTHFGDVLVVDHARDVTEPEGPGLDEHLARAAAAGVPRMVQVGCDLDAVAWTDAVIRTHPQLLGAVAVHPNEAVLHAGVREVAPDGLEPHPQPRHEVPLDEAIARVGAVAAANPRVRAIGETGLDYFRAGPAGRAVQREAFRAHVALAKELDLALQIHDRDAHADVIDVLRRDGAPARTVFHCFSGDAQLAALCVQEGWYCSFAGPVSFPANTALRAAAAIVPSHLLLVETDAPYLTVHPHRGRPNAPYLLPGTVRVLAEATGRPLDDVCVALADTAERVYGTW